MTGGTMPRGLMTGASVPAEYYRRRLIIYMMLRWSSLTKETLGFRP
jgi:hypothetical protein